MPRSRRLQHDRHADAPARRHARSRSSLTIAGVARPAGRRRSSSCIDSCSSSARRSASRRAPALATPLRDPAAARDGGRAHEIALVEQAARAAQERARGRRVPGSPRAWPRRPAGRRPCRGVFDDQERRLAGRVVAGAQVVDIAPVDAAARDAIVNDRTEGRAWIGHQRREAVLHADVVRRVRPCSTHRAD